MTAIPANVDQLPPTDLGAEQVLLGACMLSPQALTEAAELVDAADFYRPAHGELFAAYLALRAASRPVDPITVADHVGDRLGRLGGATYLHTLISSVPTASNAAFYAEIIAEKAVRRRLVEAGTRITQLAYANPDGAAADLVERARTTLDEVPAGARAAGGRQLRRTRASEVVMRRLLFLWQARIVLGALTLLAGREGIGKSTVAVDIAAQVTRGTLPGELHGHPRTVIYVNSEDARDITIVPRLVAAGADLDRVVFLDAIGQAGQESPLVLPLDTPRLEAEIRDLDAALVVLDAATSVIDGSLDGDRDRQMRQGLEPISQLAARTSVSVLGIVHFGKRESGDTGKLILGSIAWSQVARSVLAVARDDETGQLVVSATKANLAPGDAASLAAQLVPTTIDTDEGPTSVGRIEWIGETHQRAQELLAGPVDPEERGQLDEAVQWLRGHLADSGGSAMAGDVIKAAKADGIAERTLQRARKKAGLGCGKRGKHWSWWLPEDTAPGEGAK